MTVTSSKIFGFLSISMCMLFLTTCKPKYVICVAGPKMLCATNTDPFPTMTNAPRDTDIVITLNKPIVGGSVNDESFIVMCSGKPISGHRWIDANQIGFLPGKTLEPNSKYTILLKGSSFSNANVVRAYDGQWMMKDYSATFETGENFLYKKNK